MLFSLELRVDKLLALIKEKDGELESMNSEIFQRDERIVKLEKSLKAKEAIIKGLEKDMSRNNEESEIGLIEELRGTIEGLREKLEKQESEIKQRDG